MQSGEEVLTRNGMFVALTGSCDYVCGTPDGAIYSSRFTEAQSLELFNEFELNEIEQRAGHYYAAISDAPTDYINYGTKQISTGGVDDVSPEWLVRIFKRASERFKTCSQIARPVEYGDALFCARSG